MKRLTLLTSAVALMLTASTTFATQESTWGQLKQNVETLEVAAKKGGNGGSDDQPTPSSPRTVSAVCDASGGYLKVEDLGGKGPTDNLIVEFRVYRDALVEPVEITMTVTGNTLSELVVAFEPGGLEFLKDADLVVTIGNDLVDTEAELLQVQHHYSDGTIETAQIKSLKMVGKSRINMHVFVPGFSRYSLGGGF